VFNTSLIELIPRLRRYAWALVGNKEAADELVQDTLTRAIDKKRLWHRGKKLRPWLFTIMHNIYVNDVIKDIRKSGIEISDEDLSRHRAVDSAESRTEFLQVCEAIEQLPEEQRQIVLLVGLEQFGYGEVASILDLPIGTVTSRLARGRARLRKMIVGKSPIKIKRIK
jgi:RNA polymerase sigma-70 factor (ECF subfamily)